MCFEWWQPFPFPFESKYCRIVTSERRESASIDIWMVWVALKWSKRSSLIYSKMGSIQSKTITSDAFGSDNPFLEYNRIIFELKRGDLIEIQRLVYRHWVICEKIDTYGTVWCFHVTASDPNQPINEIGFNGTAVLRYEPLEHILKDAADGTSSLCRINNQEEMALKMMASVGKEMPDLDQVFDYLHQNKDHTFDYDLRSNNCEHYCTLWKYGIGWSS